MSLKIITEKADNGNEFLCSSCSKSQHRSGLMNEVEYYCYADQVPTGDKIKFKVTQCTMYENHLIKWPNRLEMKKMFASAMVLMENSEHLPDDIRGKFVPFSVAQAHGYI